MGLGWFAFLIVGALAGWIAEKLMKRNHGLLRNLIVGIAGAYIGAFLFGVIGIGPSAGFAGALVTAVVGAVILLWVMSRVGGGR